MEEQLKLKNGTLGQKEEQLAELERKLAEKDKEISLLMRKQHQQYVVGNIPHAPSRVAMPSIQYTVRVG